MVLASSYLFPVKNKEDSFSTDNLTDATSMLRVRAAGTSPFFRRRRHWNFPQPVCFEADGTPTARKGANEIIRQLEKIRTVVKLKWSSRLPIPPRTQRRPPPPIPPPNGGQTLHSWQTAMVTPGNDVTISAPSGSWKVSSYIDKAGSHKILYRFGFFLYQ